MDSPTREASSPSSDQLDTNIREFIGELRQYLIVSVTSPPPHMVTLRIYHFIEGYIGSSTLEPDYITHLPPPSSPKLRYVHLFRMLLL
jgi:hypothetical protein